MYNKLMLILIVLVPFSNQLVNASNKLSNLQYLAFMLMILIFAFINKEKLKINIQHRVIFSVFASVYTIPTIIGLTIFKYDPLKNLYYILLYLIYIISLAILVSFINSDNKNVVIQMILIGNSLVLVFNLLVNLNELNADNFNWLTGGERGSRANFGFSHPNTAGMYLFLEIMLIYYMQKMKIGNKYVWSSLIVILTIFLLATGSRTAVLGMLLFFLLKLYSSIVAKLNVKLLLAILLCLIFPLLIIYLLQFNFTKFLEEASGRGTNLTQNLSVLFDQNAFIFGIAPINTSNLRLIEGLTFSDNWYVTHLIQFGFIGLILFVMNILFIISISLKKRKGIENLNIFTLLCVLLFYSGAENVMFSPGVLLSWVFWTLILFNLKAILNNN
ncbi:hypothetical protein [Paenibacillus sp. YAF4_2]|uniref:hypothetical protein n=1 Tax=Paenibacillus sp. YAF4_2 TaxID=3233085 RepID=UPI003F9636F8